ncbi:MAG TPA: hypothetical protein VGN08_06275 [Solirubrobacteraceae bacterium]|jgi:hypothetical protein
MLRTPVNRERARRPAIASAVLAVLCLLTWCGSNPPEASADGDPASDVLLAQDVFYPYQPQISPMIEATLAKTLRSAAEVAGLHLKVALIGAPEELGLVPNFFGHPQTYAKFLDREISFNHPQELLVVMPAGFGVVPAANAAALAGVPVYSQQSSDGLGRSAILAVVALARHAGHPIPAPSTSAAAAHSSSPALLVFGLPALVLLAGGVALKLGAFSRLKRRPRESDGA